jgi:hypothetical protein
VKRVLLLTCSVAAIAVAQAHAADLTISTATTTAISTGNVSGNITITPAGSVAVTTAGAAVTLNSSNFVLNSGNITNSSGTGAIGVNIVGGYAGNFTNSGTITVPATGSPFTSAGQFGVLLNGNGTFTGNLVTTAGSTVTVSGVSPAAIAVQSPLTGDLTLGGTEKAIGSNATGVAVTGNVSGALTNSGTITVLSEGNSTTAINTPPGSALAIGSNIVNGVLNTATGGISTTGLSPAFAISPSVGGNAVNITIGNVSDLTAPGNSVLNRGTIAATGNQPGVNTLAVEIGQPIGTNAGATTTLSGGFYNNGSIAASATSDNGNATTISPSATSATAMAFGFGTNVGNLTNDTLGAISATTGGPLGGNATAITIQGGATVSSLINKGTISANAVTTNDAITSLAAYAIQDKSGNLTSIVNNGTISATATPLANGQQLGIAADLSTRSGNTTFTDTGVVRGDILFGTFVGNSLTIEGASAIVTGRIRATGVVNVAVSGNATGGTLVTNSAATLGTLNVGQGGTLNLQVGQATSVVSTTGNVTFDPASHLVLTPVSLLAASGNITLIRSNTAFAIPNATLATATVPFLYTGNVTQTDSKTLMLQYALKTPAALGLTGNSAAIFQPAVAAAAQDSPMSAVFAGLNSSAQVQAATQALLPTVSSASRTIALSITDSSTGAVGLRQRTLLMNGSPEADSAVWGQGFYNLFTDHSSAGYDAHGSGGTVGVDYSQAMMGHVGVALTIFEGTTTANAPQTSKTDVQWIDGSIYMGLRSGPYFFDGAFNIAGAKFAGKREVDIGNLSRTAATSGSTAFLIGQSLTAGYILDMGNWKLAPEASLDAMFLNDSAYNETGGGAGVDLSVRSRSENSLRAFVGLAASGVYNLDAFRIVPQLLAGYSYDFLRPNSIDAAFVSVPGSVFSISGPPLESSRFLGSANVNLSIDHWSLGFVYDISGGSSAIAQTAGATLVGRF